MAEVVGIKLVGGKLSVNNCKLPWLSWWHYNQVWGSGRVGGVVELEIGDYRLEIGFYYYELG